MNKTLFFLTLLIGIIIQYLLATYLLQDLIFADSHADLLETAMYMSLALPPFIIAVLFYKETGKLIKSILYSGFFYLISGVGISLFDYVPGHPELMSRAFYVTGGGVTPFGITIIPLFLTTCIILFIVYQFEKSRK